MCSVGGCNRKKEARGFCHTHYCRWRKHSDPMIVKKSKGKAKPLIDRFLEKVELTATCWLWKASTKARGYGRLLFDGKGLPAHRAAYLLFVGPPPDDLVADHLCRNRACVNPWHIEFVSPRTNCIRGISSPAMNARKTHCKNGHPFDENNTNARSPNVRRCRACNRDRVSRIRRGVSGFQQEEQARA